MQFKLIDSDTECVHSKMFGAVLFTFLTQAAYVCRLRRMVLEVLRLKQ